MRVCFLNVRSFELYISIVSCLVSGDIPILCQNVALYSFSRSVFWHIFKFSFAIFPPDRSAGVCIIPSVLIRSSMYSLCFWVMCGMIVRLCVSRLRFRTCCIRLSFSCAFAFAIHCVRSLFFYCLVVFYLPI